MILLQFCVRLSTREILLERSESKDMFGAKVTFNRSIRKKHHIFLSDYKETLIHFLLCWRVEYIFFNSLHAG